MLVLSFTNVFQATIDWMLEGFNLSLYVLLFVSRSLVTSLYLEDLHKYPICWNTKSFCQFSCKLNLPLSKFAKVIYKFFSYVLYIYLNFLPHGILFLVIKLSPIWKYYWNMLSPNTSKKR